jgi:hypothetical protein
MKALIIHRLSLVHKCFYNFNVCSQPEAQHARMKL